MKSNSLKILILMVVCNLAALTGYYFLFNHIKTKTQTSSALINTIDLGTQKNSRLNSLRTIVKDTEEKRQQLATYFLSGDTEIYFIEQIEDLAKNSGLGVKTDSVSSVSVDTSPTKIFQMQTTTTGSWSNIMYFLSQVENLPYDIHIQGVSFNKGSGANTATSSLTWTATLDIGVAEST